MEPSAKIQKETEGVESKENKTKYTVEWDEGGNLSSKNTKREPNAPLVSAKGKRNN